MASDRKRRIAEAQEILTALGLPREQTNERAAITLLALVDLTPTKAWSEAANPLMGVTPIMEFAAKHYRKKWAPNTRETVRRFTLHQFEQAGLVVANPDEPGRPTNSPNYCYQIEPRALVVIRTFGTTKWVEALRRYLVDVRTLAQRYAQARSMRRIPLVLAAGVTIELSPGGQNALVRKVIDEFCPRFTPGARPLYVGDTKQKWAYFNEHGLGALGVVVEEHGKMPDVVVHYTDKNWLVALHQDLSIPVRERILNPECAGWSVKEGVAVKAGLHEGDVIISINGLSPLTEEGALLLNRTERELTINLEISRGGKREKFTLKL